VERVKAVRDEGEGQPRPVDSPLVRYKSAEGFDERFSSKKPGCHAIATLPANRLAY
jgi:hypothetical protein